jgi:hypothetical protein
MADCSVGHSRGDAILIAMSAWSAPGIPTAAKQRRMNHPMTMKSKQSQSRDSREMSVFLAIPKGVYESPVLSGWRCEHKRANLRVDVPPCNGDGRFLIVRWDRHDFRHCCVRMESSLNSYARFFGWWTETRFCCNHHLFMAYPGRSFSP